MSYTYYSSSASGSPSASETASNNTSPAPLSTPLWPSKVSDETDSQSTHSRGTPNRMPVDLPRGASTGKGGCWCASYHPTLSHFANMSPSIIGHVACEERCALNEIEPSTSLELTTSQKCDEQREDNSCHTCKRLRIECLGWGTRRPEWMRVSTVCAFMISLSSSYRTRKLWKNIKLASKLSLRVLALSAVSQNRRYCRPV